MATDTFNPGNTSSASPVKGLPKGADGNPLTRLELRVFAQDKPLFDLYLLGLWAWQKVPQDQDLSWFQICGIHGKPYTKWPQNDPLLDKLKKSDDGFSGQSTLYQAMQYVAGKFTEEEGRDSYLQALERFRLPYWDWALPASTAPVFPTEASSSDKVNLPMPAAMREAYTLTSQDPLIELHNPLFAYPFADGTDGQFLIHNRSSTQRYDADPEPTPEEREQNLLKYLHPYSQEWRETLGNVPVERNLRERVVYLLQSYDNFASVSNNKWDPIKVNPIDISDERPVTKGMGFGSIEDIHNALHDIAGGQIGPFDGHMAHVPISAFDPIFWLHHTNIDRLFAIWQGLHDSKTDDNTYVTPQESEYGNWITSPGGTEDAETDLAPFYQSSDTFWKSEGVRSTDTFGYVYSETQRWKYNSEDEYRTSIRNQLKDLYPNASLGNTIKTLRTGGNAASQLEQALRERASTLATVIKTQSVPNNTSTLLNVVHQKAVATSSASTQSLQSIVAALPDGPGSLPIYEVSPDLQITTLATKDTYLEWLVNIKAQKHTLDGEYSVHIFLDNVEETYTNLFAVAPNHVGTFYPFGQSTDTGCGKCKADQAARTEISGQIPLTMALAERYFAGLLRSLQPDEVVPYLQRNLHWQVVASNGDIVTDRNRVAGLLVGVSSNEVTLPDGEDEPPIYSENITHYPEITTNVSGGSRGNGTGMTLDKLFFDIEAS